MFKIFREDCIIYKYYIIKNTQKKITILDVDFVGLGV